MEHIQSHLIDLTTIANEISKHLRYSELKDGFPSFASKKEPMRHFIYYRNRCIREYEKANRTSVEKKTFPENHFTIYSDRLIRNINDNPKAVSNEDIFYMSVDMGLDYVEIIMWYYAFGRSLYNDENSALLAKIRRYCEKAENAHSIESRNKVRELVEKECP